MTFKLKNIVAPSFFIPALLFCTSAISGLTASTVVFQNNITLSRYLISTTQPAMTSAYKSSTENDSRKSSLNVDRNTFIVSRQLPTTLKTSRKSNGSDVTSLPTEMAAHETVTDYGIATSSVPSKTLSSYQSFPTGGPSTTTVTAANNPMSSTKSGQEQVPDPTTSPVPPMTTKSPVLARLVDSFLNDVLEQLDLGSVASLVIPLIERNLKNLHPTKMVEDLLQSALSSSNSSIPQPCIDDVLYFTAALFNKSQWAIQMFDAAGKPESGIGMGKLKFVGNFDECLEVDHKSNSTNNHIKGGYYVVLFALSSNAFQSKLQSIYLAPPTLEWHFCLPDSCPASAFNDSLFNKSIGLVSVTVQGVTSRQPPEVATTSDGGLMGTLCLAGILSFLVVVATIYDTLTSPLSEGMAGPVIVGYGREVSLEKGAAGTNRSDEIFYVPDEPDESRLSYKVKASIVDKKLSRRQEHIELPVFKTNSEENDDQASSYSSITSTSEENRNDIVLKEPKWRQLLLAFSLTRNASKLFNPRHGPESLTCLHGIRVLSMAWVIYGHCYGFMTGEQSNLVAMVKDSRNFWFAIMSNGTVAVDSFFVLSGTLTAYLFLLETAKSRCVTWKQMALFYIHRIWRLTPAYMAVLLCHACLYPYLVGGPIIPPLDSDSANCRTNWWTNLLYVNNLVNMEKMCMAWSWYLADDMQFFVVAPLALIPLAKGFRKSGLLMILAFLATHVVSNVVIYHQYNVDQLLTDQFQRAVYLKPYTRVAPYAFGLFTGWLLQQTKCQVKMGRLAVILGWVLVLVLMAVTLLITNDSQNHSWDLDANAAYETLERIAWGIVVSWVIFVCSTGNGGFVQSILGWEGWLAFSRLTYGAYLIHLIVLFVDVGTARSLSSYTSSNLFLQFIGLTTVTFLYSGILSLVVEAPCVALEKAVLSGSDKIRT